MGKTGATLGTLFGKENLWWEQEKQRERQKQQQEEQEEQEKLNNARKKPNYVATQNTKPGPAYGQPHDPVDAYKESEDNIKGAIQSVSQAPGQPQQQGQPYVVKNRQLSGPKQFAAFMAEASQFASSHFQGDKLATFNKLTSQDKMRVMESHNPDNELYAISRDRRYR